MIKNLLVLAFLSLTVSAAYAAPTAAPVCPAAIPCGTYEGSGSWYDIQNQPTRAYSEKIVITAVNATTANIKVYIYTGTIGAPWTDATLVFDPKSKLGQFKMTSAAGSQFGTGFCNSGSCTFSFAPVNVTDETPPFVNTFVDILRFDGNTLKRYNMVADSAVDTELMFQRSDLTKK